MAKKFEPIYRCKENPVFWKTETGEVLGFQCAFNYEHRTMTISDGKENGKRYNAMYGVVKEGQFYRADNESRINGEAQYYVELEEDLPVPQ